MSPHARLQRAGPRTDVLDTDDSALRARIFALPPALQVVARTMTLGLVGFHVLTAALGTLPNFMQRAIHTGIALCLIYLLFGAGKNGKPRWHDFAAMVVSLIVCGNIIVSYDRIVDFGLMGSPPTQDLVFGALLIMIAIETGRRTIGAFLPVLAIIFLAYAYFGKSFPGILAHRGFDLVTILEISYVTTRGLWGMVTAVIATTVAIFIIFGATISASGAGEAMKNLSLWIGGKMVGGGAYVAIAASSMFGTISGSTVANVVATGSFTIPMMKKLGYDRSFAGAVEATASTGGQIMPPVMGAAAFIMAEYLSVPYRDVMIPAIIPALLFYAGVFFSVRFYALRNKLPPVPRNDIPSRAKVFKFTSILALFLPLGTLMYYLLAGIDTSRAVLYALIVAVATHLVQGPRAELGYRLRRLFVALEGGGIALAVITPLALCAQVIITVVGLTGIAIKLSETIIALSQGYLAIALVLAAAVAIVLGMGLPTPAAYVVAAAVLAPSVSNLGVPPIAAHMFLFYFAVMSSITPPVCAAVYVAANVADAPWLRVANYAMALALPGLIVPFLFVADPVMLFQGTIWGALQSMVTGIVGVAAMSAAVMGYMFGPLLLLERLLLVVGALLLLKVGLVTDAIGVGILLMAIGSQLLRNRRQENG